MSKLTSADVAAGGTGVGTGVGEGLIVGVGVLVGVVMGVSVGWAVGDGAVERKLGTAGVRVAVSSVPNTFLFLLLFFPSKYIEVRYTTETRTIILTTPFLTGQF